MINNIFIFDETGTILERVRDTNIKSITIPNGVKSIGDYALMDCRYLSSVFIPSSVTSIGKDAFNDCIGLTSIEIPSSVTSIGDHAFGGCRNLTKVIVNDIAAWCNISFGDAWANPFYYAHHLYSDENTEITKLIIPSSVTSIEDYAFFGFSGLTSVVIPSSVTSIGNYAFKDCSGLTSIEIPSSVTSIGGYAFFLCIGLTSITIPSSVTSIGSSAFEYCSGLTSIIVESDNPVFDSRDNCNAIIKTASNTLIAGCKNTKIPSSVTSIGNYAFQGCTGLTSITIPNSVTSIGDGAFFGCSGLKKVIVNDIAAWCIISFGNLEANPLYYAHHLYSDENTEITKLIIPSSVTSIGKGAFEYCSDLTSIEISDNVESIGEEAFSGCKNLYSVSIPDNVTNIGRRAFAKIHFLGFINILAYRLKDSYSLGSELQKHSQSFIPSGTIYRKGKPFVIIENVSTNSTNDKHCESDNSDLAHVQDFLEISWSVKYIDNSIYLRSIYGDKYEPNEDVFNTVTIINEYEEKSKCISPIQKYLDEIKTIFCDNIDGFFWKDKLIEFAGELNENDIIMENYGIYLTDEKERDFFKFILTPVEEKDELWRYTTKTSLFLTLTSKKHNMLSLNCMNDISEIYYSDKVIDEKSYLVRNSINEANNVFILSCCDKEKSDDLMMWRLYAKDGEGVSLCYRLSTPVDYNYFYLAKVCYGIKNSHPELEYLQRIMNWSLQPHFRFRKWNVWKHFFKPYEFNYEKEIRLIYYEHEPFHAIETKWIEAGNSEIATPMKLFSLDQTIKTYLNFPLSLTKVLIGPKSKEADVNRIQFSKMASEAGIFNPKTIPEFSVSKIDIYR